MFIDFYFKKKLCDLSIVEEWGNLKGLVLKIFLVINLFLSILNL